MKVLITGHTGFKGAWLSLLLTQMGHEVSGLSLPPRNASLAEAASLTGVLHHEILGDVCDLGVVQRTFELVAPDRVFHLAAQPLVRYSYLHPRETYETNVNGTLNVLESATAMGDAIESVIVVTTDKVYENRNLGKPFIEDDPLGGFDPYSSSKAMADLLTRSWGHCHPGMRLASARAGNVIGGGDDSSERLMPDLIAAFQMKQAPQLRNPNAIRPWQHVLDCLYGYWLLSEGVYARGLKGAWNFGPGKNNEATVATVAELTAKHFNTNTTSLPQAGNHPHEAGHLTLDSTKAETILDWNNMFTLEEAVQETVQWHQLVSSGESPLEVTMQQIKDFLNRVLPASSADET